MGDLRQQHHHLTRLTPHRPLGKLGDVTFWGPRDRLRCLRAGKEAEGQ